MFLHLAPIAVVTTAWALVLLPVIHVVRLPAWVASVVAVLANGDLTGWAAGIFTIDAPIDGTQASIAVFCVATLACVGASRFAFRHAMPWQIVAVLLSTLCLVFAAPIYPVLAFFAGVAVGMFRILSLKFSIALFSVVGCWLLAGVIAIHPVLWADTELGALARQNWDLVTAPLLGAVGLQFGASLHRRMLETRLGRERVLATRELSALCDRMWLTAGAAS